MRNEHERWWESPTFTGQTDDAGTPLFSEADAPAYHSEGLPEQQEMAPTCERGGHHRWDEADARCLDCGREAAEIADELYDWLAEKEDYIEQQGDQIEAMRILLEDAESLIEDDNGDFSGWLERCSAFLAELKASYES